MKFEATEFKTAGQAILHAQAQGQTAIFIQGKYLVVKDQTATDMVAQKKEFAFLLCDRCGRIVTIPANG